MNTFFQDIKEIEEKELKFINKLPSLKKLIKDNNIKIGVEYTDSLVYYTLFYINNSNNMYIKKHHNSLQDLANYIYSIDINKEVIQ